MLNKVVYKLNKMVENNTELLIISFCIITLLLLVKNMFIKSSRKNSRLEGFKGRREIVYFYMDGCGHCKDFNPKWGKFVQGTSMQNKKINASSDDPLIKKLGVTGYPTIVVIEGNKKLGTFEGKRTVENLNTFANKYNK